LLLSEKNTRALPKWQNNGSSRNFGVAEFRTLNTKSREKQIRVRLKDPKLSFRKLAAEQTKKTAARVQKVPTKPAPNRKILYEKAYTYLNQAFSSVRNRKSFSLEPGLEIMRKMAEAGHPQDELFIMAIHLDNRFKFVIHHSVNVAIYALRMAENLGYARTKQLELGMAGLLHDIGMAVIPDKIIYKQEKLRPQEIKILRERPNYSYKILRSFGESFAYLSECSAQVYERIDGSGYPLGLKTDEINEYAQIIGLLDMHEALIHSRPQREKLPHFAAVKEIFNTCKNRFPRKYLKSLLSIFTVFPIHSYVRLNSDAIGKVIETYPEQPMRPKLQIVFDSQKRKILTERVVVLPENPLLNIVDSVSENELHDLSRL
jgi:HD-GYP domain-containing protein (c-di-GMP phosphodiesterase class II)